MYLFVNPYAFEHPKVDAQESDVMEALDNLAKLFIELKKLEVDLILNQSFCTTSICGKAIREYATFLRNDSLRSLAILLSKTKPFCSDVDKSFENDEDIAFGNCKEEIEKIDICYTFLSCALYYKDPILTINNLCQKPQFKNSEITIICDDSKHSLQNYQLIPYSNVVQKINESLKYQEEAEFLAIDNWDDYKEYINTKYEYTKITDACIDDLKSRYSYSNEGYSNDIRNKIKRIELFIKEHGGRPDHLDFKLLGTHYNPESSTRYEALQKSHDNIFNFVNQQVYLNWHMWIQKDCRLYFEREKDYVCYVHYSKKIDV